MSSTFSIALSALRADSDAINTTGNNLANLNTTGFKGSSVQFKNLLSEYAGGASGGGVGLGVATPISAQVFTQGAIQRSNLPLATAIQGNGFFVVRGSDSQQMFTRDGSFKVDANGVLQTQSGENVQGWTATNGSVNATGAPSNLVLPTGTLLPPKPTSEMTLNVNLDASASVPANNSPTFSAPIQVFDSLGTAHTLSVNFTKTAANAWNYAVTIPGTDVTSPTSNPVSTGAIAFNPDGTLDTTNTSPTKITLTIPGLTDGAKDLSIDWNLLNSDGSATLTQYAQTSSLASSQQDGTAAAQLTQVSIENGGQIMATYSNGKQILQGQLALAAIENPDSLKNVGNNNFVAAGETASPAIGMPQSGGRGQIVGGAVEGSNVDMGTEFTNLIVYQSSYGASSKVITTANTMSEDLLSLIR